MTKHPVDVHVGKKLRHIRWMRGVSQQEIGSAVGVKPQQVQKYERGDSRISASRLYLFAEALKVPTDYFYSGYGQTEQNAAKHRQPSSGMVGPVRAGSDLSIAQIRAEVRTVYPDLQDRLAYMVQLVLDERSKFALIPKPNELEALEEYEKEQEFLHTLQAGLISVHEDMPRLTEETVSEADAETIKEQLFKLAELANQAIHYLDNHQGTYGGLYKIGLISGIAGLLSTIPGVNFTTGAALPTLIFGAQTFRVIVDRSKS